MFTLAAHTLGCKLNFAETAHLLAQLPRDCFSVVEWPAPADFYVINTCTVTSTAERKCRTAIHSAHRLNPNAKIFIIGCYATLAASTLSLIPGVEKVLPNDSKHLLPDYILQSAQFPAKQHQDGIFPIAYNLEQRTRAFLKIQDGCDYFCSYCAIPFARGRAHSATIDQVLQAANRIAQSGINEIVLTGVNTGTFGQERGESLLDLLKILDNETSIPRYRISSIEPNLLTPKMVEFVARSRAFMPHFHIPLQAANDNTLRLMRRRYTTAEYSRLILSIKQAMPHACIAADIIAAFNGESPQDFEDSIAFLHSIPISYLHVFTYSQRPNTAALKIKPAIPPQEQHRRSNILHLLSDELLLAFHRSQIGSSRPVLWEHTDHDGQLYGYTDNYIRLSTATSSATPNTITSATITEDNIVK